MRTFGIAKKQINRAGLLSFTKQLLAAREIEDDKARDDKIHDLYRKIESNLHVVGATGVEVSHNCQDLSDQRPGFQF